MIGNLPHPRTESYYHEHPVDRRAPSISRRQGTEQRHLTILSLNSGQGMTSLLLNASMVLIHLGLLSRSLLPPLPVLLCLTLPQNPRTLLKDHQLLVHADIQNLLPTLHNFVYSYRPLHHLFRRFGTPSIYFNSFPLLNASLTRCTTSLLCITKLLQSFQQRDPASISHIVQILWVKRSSTEPNKEKDHTQNNKQSIKKKR